MLKKSIKILGKAAIAGVLLVGAVIAVPVLQKEFYKRVYGMNDDEAYSAVCSRWFD